MADMNERFRACAMEIHTAMTGRYSVPPSWTTRVAGEIKAVFEAPDETREQAVAKVEHSYSGNIKTDADRAKLRGVLARHGMLKL